MNLDNLHPGGFPEDSRDEAISATIFEFPPVRRETLDQRCADVLHAMLFGTYGTRVRSFAQLEAGAAITGNYAADQARVLAAVMTRASEHLHGIHLGHVSHQVLIDLVDPGRDLSRAAARASVTESLRD